MSERTSGNERVDRAIDEGRLPADQQAAPAGVGQLGTSPGTGGSAGASSSLDEDEMGGPGHSDEA